MCEVKENAKTRHTFESFLFVFPKHFVWTRCRCGTLATWLKELMECVALGSKNSWKGVNEATLTGLTCMDKDVKAGDETHGDFGVQPACSVSSKEQKSIKPLRQEANIWIHMLFSFLKPAHTQFS